MSKGVDKLLVECSSSGICACASALPRADRLGKHRVPDLRQGRSWARRIWVVPSWCRPPWSFGGRWFLLNCLVSLQGCYKWNVLKLLSEMSFLFIWSLSTGCCRWQIWLRAVADGECVFCSSFPNVFINRWDLGLSPEFFPVLLRDTSF